MQDNLSDIFEDFDLPFKTHFARSIHHGPLAHDEMELVWLLKGKMTIICQDKTFHLSNQNVFLIYLNHIHEIHSSEDAIIITYRFNNEQINKINLNFNIIPFAERVYTFQELSDKYHEVPLLITQILKLLMTQKNSPQVRYKIIGYYNLFMYELYKSLLKDKYLDVKTYNYDPYLIRLSQMIEYISEHKHEKVTLKALSKLINLSSYRTSHFFKQALGISFYEFLQNSRLEYALSELRDTDRPILEISKAAGFSDIKYLNQLMKDRFQMTALKYRKFIRKDLQSDVQKTKKKDFIHALNQCILEIETRESFKDTYGLLGTKVPS